jgi:hypothetical protein
MADQPPYDFVYVHTDIPEGMTIREWRTHRGAERPAAQQSACDARRRRSFGHRLSAVGRAWLTGLRQPRRARARAAGA